VLPPGHRLIGGVCSEFREAQWHTSLGDQTEADPARVTVTFRPVRKSAQQPCAAGAWRSSRNLTGHNITLLAVVSKSTDLLA
jgi:hypothetical protein